VNSIALLETGSIARGIRCLDEMAKRAPVEILQARPVCPGRYIVLVEGDVAAVEESLAAGLRTAASDVVDSLFLANPHPALPSVLRLSEKPQVLSPVGVVETSAVATALVAADAGCKTSPVELIVARLAVGMAGKSFVIFSGELSDVEAAVEAGAAVADERGKLVETTVLANPDLAVEAFLI
jgi:microcompartment protein CcmL/EutN